MTSLALKRWERPKSIHAASNLNVIIVIVITAIVIVIVIVIIVIVIMLIANITNYKVGRGLQENASVEPSWCRLTFDPLDQMTNF